MKLSFEASIREENKMAAISSLSGIQASGISSSLFNTMTRKNQENSNNDIQLPNTGTDVATQLTLKLPTKTLDTPDTKSASTDNSRYINATLSSLKVNTQVNNQQTNRVSSLLDSLGGIQMPSPYESGGGKGGIHTKSWFEMQLRRIQNTETQESSEDNLKEIRDDIESNAEQANNVDDTGMPVSAEETTSTTTPQSLQTSGVETATSNYADNQLAATTNETTAAPAQAITAEMHSSQPTASQENSPRVDIVV